MTEHGLLTRLLVAYRTAADQLAAPGSELLAGTASWRPREGQLAAAQQWVDEARAAGCDDTHLGKRDGCVQC